MADYELIGLNEAAPDLRAPTSADRGIIAGGVRVVGLAELDGGADINGSRITTVTDTSPLRQAVRVAMTAAASGSNGIQVLDNANLDMGTNNFTLHWEGSLPDWTPAAEVRLLQHRSAGSAPFTGYYFAIFTNGTLYLPLFRSDSGVNFFSTVATGITDGSFAKVTAVVVRETASAAGSITYYVNGVQLGSAVSITAAATATLTNANLLYISGSGAARTASDTTNAILYNRALSAAEVLSLCVNGPALADLNASQVPVYTSNFSAGVDGWTGVTGGALAGNIDGIGGEDNWLRFTINGALSAHNAQGAGLPRFRIGTRYRMSFKYYIPSTNSHIDGISLRQDAGSSVTGQATANVLDAVTSVSYEFTTTINNSEPYIVALDGAAASFQDIAADDVFYIKDIVITQFGITGQWNAENAQSDTGQIFDSSGNKNHGLLPAAGATIIGKPVSGIRQVRWTNTWAGTNELQYIGGVNQAILPANAYIDSIVGTVSGATPHDIIVGDGTDADRYVTITTGLATGTTTFTLANRTTDGTNLKLTVDPDTNCTMSIAWVISYRILE